jgi:AAA15 family ATPase/GTPase
MPLIENLQITNFKCFKQLEVKGLGQVNLIGGKNNVGKTAFLEAVELFSATTPGYHLAVLMLNIQILLNRRQRRHIHQTSQPMELDFFYNNASSIRISSNSERYCQIERIFGVSEDNGLPQESLRLSVSNQGVQEMFPTPTPVTRFTLTNNEEISQMGKSIKIINKLPLVNFLSSTAASEQDIADLLGEVIELGREEFVNQSLTKFDPNIQAVKPIPKSNHILLKLKLITRENLVLLSSLGEGINRYIAILCAIWANKDGFLLIDEIENGIHYTNYKKLWEIIFKTSVEANCQLFITTHSKECITAFNDMQFEVDTCNAQYFEFYKNLKTDLIVASSRDKEQLQYALTHEGRIRGE